MAGPEGTGCALNGLSAAALLFVRAMDHHRNRVATKFNLTGSEVRALTWIAEAGSITPKLLAEQMEMTTGAVTAISTHLVELDLIERVAHPHDRRSLLLKLTSDSEKIARTSYDEFQAIIGHAVHDVSAEDQARLGDLLNTMAQKLASGADLSLFG